jgi:hypothetical protein
MEAILKTFLGDDYNEYESKINYNNNIKELNNILDKILYFCNNVNYKRIKNLYINIIENYDYRKKDDFSNFDDDIQESDESDESNAYIKKNNDEIIKQYENFNTKYTTFKTNEYHKKGNIKNVQEQNKYLISKLENIISKLNIHDEKEEGNVGDEETGDDDINFNIILINDKSSLYSFYSYLKKGLFKNLHCIEANESTSENEDEDSSSTEGEGEGEGETGDDDEEYIKINKKLKIIYDTTFNKKLKELKINIEEQKKKIEELKENIKVYNNKIEEEEEEEKRRRRIV